MIPEIWSKLYKDAYTDHDPWFGIPEEVASRANDRADAGPRYYGPEDWKNDMTTNTTKIAYNEIAKDILSKYAPEERKIVFKTSTDLRAAIKKGDELMKKETDKMNSISFGNKTFVFKKIIFSPPCTIVIWDKSDKTVARCSEDDIFDPEKGLAICFMKKVLGVTANHQLHKFLHTVIDDPKNWPDGKKDDDE